VGLSRAATFAAMSHAGLYFATSGPGSATNAWTRVVSERPRAGTLVAWHSTVDLAVTGPARSTSAPAKASAHRSPGRVPNLTHMTRAQVYAVMHRADLYFSTRGPGSTNATWRSVVAESPKPGTPIAPRANVVLTTSMLPPVAPGHVRVPNLTHLSRAQVDTVMRHADLYYATRGPTAWSRVVSERPAPGSVVALRSTVVLSTEGVARVTRVTHATATHTLSVRPTAAPLTGSTHYRIGIATWYSYIPGQCATSYLPRGTQITVEDLDTGVSITCVVTDRQDYSPGRVVDLNETQFSQLTALWRGVVRVKVSW
jgi:beta-lactam-binding protein with PASTA domain